MNSFSRTALFGLLFLSIAISACRKEEFRQCPDDLAVVTEFTSPEGLEGVVYEDGNLYLRDRGICRLIESYYDPNWMDRYTELDSQVYIVTGEGLYPTSNELFDDFESYSGFLDMFPQGVTDTNRHWTTFNLQSPTAPTVEEYVELRKCILQQTCDFRDNRIDLLEDPVQPGNKVLRFTTIAPRSSGVTSKSSLSSDLTYFPQGSECWFEARYYIESGMPFSLVDIENGQFYQGPGPRVVIRDGFLAVENKFAEKTTYFPENPPAVPLQTWFTVKLHLRFSYQDDGVVELWQDGQLLLSTTGVTLPTFNSIQDNVEIGISASSEATVMYVDEVRLSERPF